MSIPVQVLFLTKSALFPKGLPEWQLMQDFWFEFKGLVGQDLPGSYLQHEGFVVGGISGERDMNSKRKVMDTLRANGFDPEIIPESM